jgi:hypothetical protein
MRASPSIPLRHPDPRGACRVVTTLVALILGAPRVVSATTPVTLDVKIIHAHNKSTQVDPRIAAIVKDLGALKFTGYDLKDQETFPLEPKSIGRMKLPSGAWLTLTPLELSHDKLRLELEIKDLKFKTVVTINKGATLAIGGPPYDRGALILAVTRRPE